MQRAVGSCARPSAGPLSRSVQAQLLSLLDYEQRARELMEAVAWAYVSGGIMDEAAVRRNRVAFEELTLRTRFIGNASEPELGTTLLGLPVGLPVLLAPTGPQTIAHAA